MDSKDNGLEAWETNAEFWDNKMGNKSNAFFNNLICPNTDAFLDVKHGDLVLDIACGNGNYSERLASCGARVIAFDYSARMVELAKKRRVHLLDKVSFYVCDATKYQEIIALKQDAPFDKAVANMAVMDISDIRPLFKAVSDTLAENGVFVFSTHHPCFTYPEEKYLSECLHKGEAIRGQPVLQNYYHRSLQSILSLAFSVGFVLDGFLETADDNLEIPIIITVRLRKREITKRTIAVEAYNETWPEEFEKIEAELLDAVENMVLSIEHVGSTSVPGLCAKPIIDIDIVIEKGMFDEVKEKLLMIGYEHEGDLGITGREAFKYSNKQHLMNHHLYVCEKNSDELERHIALRDFLRTHESERDKYSRIKIEMAKKYPLDIDRYIEGKQPVILEIYKKCGLDVTYKTST